MYQLGLHGPKGEPMGLPNGPPIGAAHMRVGSGKLSLTVTDTAHRSRRGDDGSTTLQGIRERLAALYGAAASLKVDHDGSARLWAVVEIPYERVDDRSHR